MFGQTSITLAQFLTAAGVFALLLLVATAVFAWRAQASRQSDALTASRRSAELEYRIAELSGALKGLAEQTQGSQVQLVSALDERLDMV